MKKLLSIIFLLSLLIGCSNNNISKEEKVYFDEFETIEKINDYNNEKIATILIQKSKSDFQTYLYEIIVDKPLEQMKDLKVIAYPIGYKDNEIIPTFNILDNVDVSSFNNGKTAIKINFFSNNEYSEFKVALKYNNNYKIKKIKVVNKG